MIKTVVKVTLAQFRVLEAGGTVGAHTYDPDHCLYLIDDGLVLPQDSGRYFIRTDDDGETYYYDAFNYSTIGTVAAGTSAITTSVSSSSSNSQIPTALAVYNALALAPGISTVTTSGSGNAVTSVTYDSTSHTLTITSGLTFSLSGHTHAAGDITSGTFADARIPNLNASKITAGTFDAARIPNLNASKITAGTLDAARIPDLSGTYATKSHTHTTSLATDTGTSTITLGLGSKYKLTAGGTSVIFTMPAKPSYTLSEITNRHQAYISWGGPVITQGASPSEVATIDELGHNKFAFASANTVKVFYSRDAGSTWTEFGSDNERRALVTTSAGFHIGNRTGSNNTVNDQLRILLNSNNAGGNVYCNLRRLLINLTTNGSGGCKVKVEYRTIANYRAGNDVWGDGGTYDVGGWSGWNSIPALYVFGGSNDQTGQTAQIRLTFSVTSVSTTSTNLAILQIRAIAFPLWISPSTLASTGHLYTFDIGMNATFPAALNATTLKEGGTSLVDKYLGLTATAADSTKLNGQAASYYLNYNNLTNKPTIPTVNNAKLTIQRNGSTIQTFTANASSDVTANITVPTVITDIGGWSTIGTVAAGTAAITTSVSSSSSNSEMPTALAVYNALALAPGISTVTVSGSGNGVSGVTYNSDTHVLTVSKTTFATTNTNTAGLSWDSTNHAVKASVDSTSATIPLGDTTKVGLLSIGTAAGQAAAGNHTHSAYVNQNAFGNIKVGSTNSAAGSTTDTITFAASGDLTVAIDTTNKKITYSVTLPTTLPASDVYSWAKASTKPTYNFGEIYAGNATIGDGANSIKLRTTTAWASSIYHQTTADEAVVFLNKGLEVGGTANYTTSWIFAYGDPADRPAWNTLTPALQIKGQSVVINKLLGSKVGASYNLDVNGTLNATTIYQNGAALATVATSGSYNDLTNKPTIPTVNNATLTIQKNGTTVKTFTANASTDVTANITINWSDVNNKPSTFTPSSHNHPLSEVTGWSTIGTVAAGTSSITTTISSSSSTKIVTEGGIKNYVDNHTGLDIAALKSALHQAMTVTTNSAGSNTLIIDIDAIT